MKVREKRKRFPARPRKAVTNRAIDSNGSISKNEQWARADEMEAQRGARPGSEKLLQQSLRPEPGDGINHCLPLENPAGHRKANRRIQQVHLSHRHPQIPDRLLVDPQGRNQLQPHIGTIATGTHPDKAQQCYRSGTEVIGTQEVTLGKALLGSPGFHGLSPLPEI